MNAGRWYSTRAMPTRCSWPPERRSQRSKTRSPRSSRSSACARAGGVARNDERGERLPRRPGAEPAGEDGGDDAQARRDRRALVDDADARAQAPQRAGAELPRIAVVDEQAPLARPERRAEERERASSCRRPTGRSRRRARRRRGRARRCAARGARWRGRGRRLRAEGSSRAASLGDVARGGPCAHRRPRYLTSPAERAAASMPS